MSSLQNYYDRSKRPAESPARDPTKPIKLIKKVDPNQNLKTPIKPKQPNPMFASEKIDHR